MATLNGKVVLFGGEYYSATLKGYVALGDTWVFDGKQWVQQNVTPSPSARFYSAMATLGNNVVLFGGVDASGNAIGERWLWNGTTWTQMTGLLTFPGARCGHGMATL